MTEIEEMEQFRAWKRAKNTNQLEEIFFQLESSLDNPSGRQFSAVMPSQAYRLLATAIVLLKKEVVKDE